MRQEGKKSDVSRAFSEDGALKTHVGGQALIEGIMMRGKYNWAVAVREPDGNMHVEEHDLATGREGNSWMRKPFVRGCTALVESLVLGYKALEVSVDYAFPDDEDEKDTSRKLGDEAACESLMADEAAEKASDTPEQNQDALRSTPKDESAPTRKERASTRGAAPSLSVAMSTAADSDTSLTIDEDTPSAEKAQSSDSENNGKVMAVSMVLGVILGIAFFIVAPAFVTNLIVGDYDTHPLIWNILDGVLRVLVFIGYIWIIGRMRDIRRMFMYHGAEHKTIHCYEHGLPLTPENARRFPRLHVRCGTAFLIMVMIIAILVYTIIPVNLLIGALGVTNSVVKFLLVVGVRIIFFPVIAGISYEITVRWAGSHPDNPLVKVILWPGLQMQYLTTNEPDDDMLECAIAAMQQVLDCERARAAAMPEAAS